MSSLKTFSFSKVFKLMLEIFTVEPLQGGVHFGACRLRQLFHGTYVRPGSVFHTHAPRLHVCVACGFAASIIVT